MDKTKKHILIWCSVIGLIYFFLIPLATKGYGYMGYYNYNRGASFWYWGGPNTYYDRNSRIGSISGSSVRGGGPGSGK